MILSTLTSEAVANFAKAYLLLSLSPDLMSSYKVRANICCEREDFNITIIIALRICSNDNSLSLLTGEIPIIKTAPFVSSCLF